MFKSIEHEGDGKTFTGMRETMQLENPRSALYRLTRTLTLPNGLSATLHSEGARPGDLLACIEDVPPLRQFRGDSGGVIAFSYSLAPIAAGRPSNQLIFTRGEALVEGLTLILKNDRLSDYRVKIDILPEAGCSFELPDDLLAVLGREWGILRKFRSGWSSSLRLRGNAFDRSRQIELSLQRLVAHLTATFAHPPRHYHEALLRARWRVVFWRASPLLMFFALIAGIGGLSFVNIPEDSIFRFLTVSVPTVLLFGAFTMHNRPPIEIPSLPRRPIATTWRQPSPIQTTWRPPPPVQTTWRPPPPGQTTWRQPPPVHKTP